MTKVVIVHRDPLMQIKLRNILNTSLDYEIVGTFCSIEPTLITLKRFDVKYLILEYSTKISIYIESLAAISGSARIVLLKEPTIEDEFEYYSINPEIENFIYIYEQFPLNGALIKFLQQLSETGISSRQPNTRKLIENLNSAEKKILELIADKKSTKQISELVFLSPKTIENKRYQMCKKLNLSGHNSLLVFAIQSQKFF